MNEFLLLQHMCTQPINSLGSICSATQEPVDVVSETGTTGIDESSSIYGESRHELLVK